jgi:methionine biosynthesis protein MetW
MNSHELFVKNKFKIVSRLIPPKSKILDIGCGDGDLKNFLDSPSYYGIDGNKEYILTLTNQSVKAKQMDFNKEEMPFKNEKFDFILMLDILEHVANPKKMIQDSKKRLNEGGKLIITLPNDYHLLNKIRFILNKSLTEDAFAPYGHLHYFPIKMGERFLKSSGLKIEKKIILPPVKPQIVPQSIKNVLALLFPQSFARDILYVLA